MNDVRRDQAGGGTQVHVAARPSAGMPLGDDDAEDRIVELEARLSRLEGGAGVRVRGRAAVGRLFPPEAGRHFRNAGREQLLGIRSIVDFWIRRLDTADERAGTESGRERIEID